MASAPMTPAGTGGEPLAPDLLDTPAAGPAAVRGGALRVGGYFAGALVGALAYAVLSRYLGVVRIGRYTTALSLVAIVAGLSDLGLTAIGVRELSVRGAEGRERFAANLLGLRILLSVGGTIIITGFALGVGYGAMLSLGVGLAGVGLVLQSCQSTLAISLMSDLRWGWVSALDLVRGVLSAALIIALVAAGAQLVAFLAVTIPVGIVVLALNAWVVRGRIPMLPAFHASEWRGVLRAVLPYSAAVAAATLYFRLAVVLVSLLGSALALGYFSVSYRVIEVLLVLPGLVVGAAFPIFSRAARDDRARLAYALGRVFEVTLLLGIWISLCLAIGSSLAIKIIGGPKFAPAAAVLAIQGIGLAASFPSAVWANGLLSLGRYRVILAINLMGLAAGIVLVSVLVSVDGARGAAIGTAAGEFVGATLNAAALTRTDRRLAPPLRIVPAAAAAVGLAALTTLIDAPALVSVVVASVVYFGVVLALGAVPAELREHIPRLRR